MYNMEMRRLVQYRFSIQYRIVQYLSILYITLYNNLLILHSRAKSMNEITWHESAIWFFIAQKLLFANQYVRKFQKFLKISNIF